jgi:hypothetical protein
MTPSIPSTSLRAARTTGGEPRAIVLHIRWAHHGQSPKQGAAIGHPGKDGRYYIGGWEWTWYMIEDEGDAA